MCNGKVLFTCVRTEYLDITATSFGFKGLSDTFHFLLISLHATATYRLLVSQHDPV
jgi:hypothetical protein